MLKHVAVLVLIVGGPSWHSARTRSGWTLQGKPVAQTASGRFAKAQEQFDPTMNRVLPAARLKVVRDDLTQQYGPLQRAAVVTTDKVQQYEVVCVRHSA
jgi:hypothetical protein